jgi:hypothetical protein
MQSLIKYSITPASGNFQMAIPEKAVILSLGYSYSQNSLAMYAIMDSDNQPVTRNFFLVSAGDEIPKIDMRFIGSTYLDNVQKDFHLFELI